MSTRPQRRVSAGGPAYRQTQLCWKCSNQIKEPQGQFCLSSQSPLPEPDTGRLKFFLKFSHHPYLPYKGEAPPAESSGSCKHGAEHRAATVPSSLCPRLPQAAPHPPLPRGEGITPFLQAGSSRHREGQEPARGSELPGGRAELGSVGVMPEVGFTRPCGLQVKSPLFPSSS